MKRTNIIYPILLAVMLGGCASTAETYNIGNTEISVSPTLRREVPSKYMKITNSNEGKEIGLMYSAADSSLQYVEIDGQKYTQGKPYEAGQQVLKNIFDQRKADQLGRLEKVASEIKNTANSSSENGFWNWVKSWFE